MYQLAVKWMKLCSTSSSFHKVEQVHNVECDSVGGQTIKFPCCKLPELPLPTIMNITVYKTIALIKGDY